jgi:phage gpG-like protein
MIKKVKVKVKPYSTLKHLTAMKRRGAAGFNNVFQWTQKKLQADMRNRFKTNAYGTWKPLEPRTVAWKTSEGYGRKGVLVRTGALRDSLTKDNSRGAVRRSGRFRMQFGTDIEYARNHQFGDGVPQRVLIPFDFVGPVGVITHMYPKSLKLTVGALAMERIIYGYKRPGQVYTFVKKSGLRGSVPIGWLKTSFDEASYIDGGKLTRDR